MFGTLLWAFNSIPYVATSVGEADLADALVTVLQLELGAGEFRRVDSMISGSE